jgi:predicted outer membrane repeat protein
MVQAQVSPTVAAFSDLSESFPIPEARITNTVFSNNSATNGGAVHFPLVCGADLRACQHLRITGPSMVMSGNTASGGSGSAVWLTAVRTRC